MEGGGGGGEKAAPGSNGASAAAPKVSAEMLEKLEKTKRLLQAQKELQEKLKKLPQVRFFSSRRCDARVVAAAAASIAAAYRRTLMRSTPDLS